MLMKKILNEIDSFTNKGQKTLALIGTTSRKSLDFAVLPRRKALCFESINFLVSNNKTAEECLKLLDGKVEYILIDVEAKKNINLENIAKKNVKNSLLLPYKPNDATVEAADLFLLHYFKNEIKDKKILIYGVGNIGGKLALRLAERGANVFLYSRNYKKIELVGNALNSILPKYSICDITPLDNLLIYEDFFDSLISFVTAEKVIDQQIIHSLKKKALVIDGGINNFHPGFYENAFEKLLNCYRLDVRLGFLYTLIPLIQDVSNFFTDVQGKALIGNVKIVAGGAIGKNGDIIVDTIKSPSQIIGIANGIGGVKDPFEYTFSDKERLDEVQKHICSIDKVPRNTD